MKTFRNYLENNIQRGAKSNDANLGKENSWRHSSHKENSAIIKVFRADGTIHVTVNGEEKKFWVDKFYYPKLKAATNVYNTLMELVRNGYAGEI